MTSFGEVHRVHAALAAGAAGYVLKDADVDEIVFAIRAAHRGEVHLDAAVTRHADPLPGRPAPTGTARSPGGSGTCWSLVAQGRSNREIARRCASASARCRPT